jgi:hypothetical protein
MLAFAATKRTNLRVQSTDSESLPPEPRDWARLIPYVAVAIVLLPVLWCTVEFYLDSSQYRLPRAARHLDQIARNDVAFSQISAELQRHGMCGNFRPSSKSIGNIQVNVFLERTRFSLQWQQIRYVTGIAHMWEQLFRYRLLPAVGVLYYKDGSFVAADNQVTGAHITRIQTCKINGKDALQ